MNAKLLILAFIFIGNIVHAGEIKRTGDEAFLSTIEKLQKLFPKKTKINENCEIEILNKDEDNFKIKLKQKKNTLEMTFERDQVLAPARVDHPALEAFLDHTEVYYEDSDELTVIAHHDTNRSDGNIQRGSLMIMDLKKPYASLKGNIAFKFYVQYIISDGRLAAGPSFECSMNGRLKDYGINTEF